MPSLSPRSDLESLPKYVPGRTIEGAIKLASNEVPGGPLPSVQQAVTAALTTVNRYPDNGAQALRERLSQELDVPQERLAIGCGSVSLCQQMIQAVCRPGDEALFAWRSFEAYPIVAQVAHAVGVKVPLTPAHGLDLDAMLAAITERTKLVFVCNPNNPTGTALHAKEIERFLDAVPPHVLVVLDEAYKEFVTDSEVPDGVEFTRTRDNVAVLRTFSKAYGLAGLRVGYAVAPEPIAQALQQVYVAFSVNSLAQIAAIASLDAADELLARCRDIIAERERVRNALLEMGYEIPPSQANFVWFPLGERTVAFAEHMLDHKLIVRPFAGDGARVTIGTPEENDQLLAAAREFAAI
ncbi:histidinol-phosphate aminotransferase [Amycolatopsis sulphurea]|uniref:Aromatic amino acid aminotransferase n=1 Tax=Amycolatopsis sulphurea TaxID=76022 RepID=A0A2A9FB60_9PSEU|nr:histidinol-phosphate transaminase [Amycolatopsis sulphurea]PFG48011.1 histidinol-phosphate aminotransferase [Amycolatopsis sulphurea]